MSPKLFYCVLSPKLEQQLEFGERGGARKQAVELGRTRRNGGEPRGTWRRPREVQGTRGNSGELGGTRGTRGGSRKQPKGELGGTRRNSEERGGTPGNLAAPQGNPGKRRLDTEAIWLRTPLGHGGYTVIRLCSAIDNAINKKPLFGVSWPPV